MIPEPVDTLLHGRYIVPVVPRNQVLENHTLVLHKTRIRDILPTREAKKLYQSSHTHHFANHALIPGLVNCHTHAAMNLLRGLADDLPLHQWLEEHIWPAEQRCISEEFVADGVRLALLEMLRSGTTCYNDMYFFPDVAGRVTAQAGMRGVMGMIVINFTSAWARDLDDYLKRARQVHALFAHEPLISTALAPHAPYSVSDDGLRQAARLAEELDIPVHMHIHETSSEVDQAQATDNCRPLERLEKLGLLSRRLLAVHMTQVNEEEQDLVAARGVSVVHCPESNLKLASGCCPVASLLSRGINVALGTDGAASNNDLDMLAEMRTGSLLGKGVAADARALPAWQVLEMATINGARALGLEKCIGSLEPGKAADITVVDLGRPECQPLYHPISQLVYAAGREMVTDVWVAGRHLLASRQATTLDQQAILAQTRTWRQRIASLDDNPSQS